MDLAAFFFGLFVGIFIFAFSKACQQTRSIWRRTHSLRNAYLFLVWGEALANLVFAITTILFINGVIKGSLGYYILAVLLWSFQVELLPQIIANRVALIMTNKRKAAYLKWGLAASITVVCIAVCYIWVVAHLDGATPAQVELNIIFEKIEKSFFLIIDLSLNLYFLYLVRYRLIADGLSKYWRLFNFNIGMVMISTILDACLLGFLSLENQFIYVQFAPLAYTAKLYIELLMANLISKVVRSTATGRNEGWYSSSRDKSNPTNYVTSRVAVSGPNGTRRGDTIMSKLGKTGPIREGSNGSEIHLATYPEPHGITKTVQTTVVVGDHEDGNSDRTFNQDDGTYGVKQSV
ncbi:hypothetical protein FDECE_5826 [Fusarium decemcellulare]|nr:hypothetical protein FDECE_5826 [Fusarium decemcellulare]